MTTAAGFFVAPHEFACQPPMSYPKQTRISWQAWHSEDLQRPIGSLDRSYSNVPGCAAGGNRAMILHTVVLSASLLFASGICERRTSTRLRGKTYCVSRHDSLPLFHPPATSVELSHRWPYADDCRRDSHRDLVSCRSPRGCVAGLHCVLLDRRLRTETTPDSETDSASSSSCTAKRSVELRSLGHNSSGFTKDESSTIG